MSASPSRIVQCNIKRVGIDVADRETGLNVDTRLRAFIDDEVLPSSGCDPDSFWPGLEALLRDLTPENAGCSPAATNFRP